MFEVVFLGTAGAIPTPDRSLPATVLRHGAKKFLIDCGDGTTRQLAGRSGARGLEKALTEPLFILLTHEHVDHILGIATLFYYLDMTTNAKVVHVRGCSAAMARVRGLMEMIEFKSNLRVLIEDISPGVVYRDEDMVCTAFLTGHTPESLGFAFEEHPYRPFLPEAAERLGVAEGPLRADLASGKSVRLEAGAWVTPDQVLGPAKAGRKVVVTGDAVMSASLIEACQNADCLIAEAAYLEQDRALAVKNRHLTAYDASRLASEAKARTLYLHHISARYSTDIILEEASAGFKRVKVACDFDYVRI